VIPLSTVASPDPRLLGGAISIGNFDGVHLGHAALVGRLRTLAQRIGGLAVAVTFDPPPAAVLRPGTLPPQLTTIARRDALLRRCGADGVVLIHTDRDLLSQTPEIFFRSVVTGSLQARGMVEGPNFFFGKDRAGNPHLLKRLCTRSGMECEIVEPESIGDRMISSTRIRELLQQGDVTSANQMLTARYRIEGFVVAGAGRGRTLGFPTANLDKIETLSPGMGVYACWATVGGQPFAAAVHIGPNPTFGDARDKVEVHLLDFSGDLYDRPLAIDFVHQVRPVRRFDSGESLKTQLSIDLAAIRSVLADHPYC
jgi:riboflavin kinase/FMN adenylyltransferase